MLGSSIKTSFPLNVTEDSLSLATLSGESWVVGPAEDALYIFKGFLRVEEPMFKGLRLFKELFNDYIELSSIEDELTTP